MAKRRIWKRIFYALGFLLLALVALVLTAPFWVPPLLERGADRFGVQYEKLERLDDGRFAITDLVRTNESFDLEISRIEGFRPWPWYRQAKDPDTNDLPNFLVINGWKLVIHEDRPEKPDEPKPERGVYDYYQLAEKYVELAKQWVPRALLQNGVVEFQDRQVGFTTITWENGLLEGAGVWPEDAVPIDIKARLTDDQPWQLSVAMHPLDFRTRLRAFETNRTVVAQLDTFYKESRLDLDALFSTNGLVPVKATLISQDFNLPADLVKLQNYQNLTGDLSGRWERGEFTLNLEAHAEPLSSATNLPPVDLLLAAAGNTNFVRIGQIRATAPGLQLSASAPIELDYQGRLRSERSELQISAELEQLPWGEMKGTIDGNLLLEQGDKLPLVDFRLRGRNLGFNQFEASALEAEGEVDWPEVQRLEGELRFSDGSVQFAASGNIEQQQLAEATLRVQGAVAREALPPGITYDSIDLSARASGPLTNLQHEARVQLRGFQAPQIHPLNLDLQWRARQADFDQLALLARAGPAELYLAGTGNVDRTSTNLVVRELRLSRSDETYLALAEPFQVSLLSTNLAGAGPTPLISLGRLRWQGENRALHLAANLAWPSSGDISFAATNVSPDLFQHFITRSLSGLRLAQLGVDADWNQGPLHASVSGDLSVVQEPFDRLSARMNLEMDGSGVTLTDLNVVGTNGTIIIARGFLPVSVHPVGTDPVQLSTRENLDFHLRTAPNETFWAKIGELAKVQLGAPSVSLDVSGTTRQPTGKLEFSVASVELMTTNQMVPEVRNIEGTVLLNEEVLRIPSIRLEVEGEPLMLTGETPLGGDFWALRREQVQEYFLTNTTARLAARELDVASFVRFAPEYIAPAGSISIDAGLDPGLSLTGSMRMTNVSTRPLAKLGVIENISAAIQLEGREIRVANLSATLGGETVTVQGKLDLSQEELERTYPGVHFTVKGQNVPLARNPDVILRSDLDLVISNAKTNPPIISGTVNLQDSVLLQDIATLVPGRVASPRRRPPYFSIDQDPLDEWVLDLRVRGVDFMRVRSPFFQGQVSANFHVTGNLEEPMALGEATITSGRIIFPFGTLGVNQALVSLTTANPYLPHLFVVAKGRVFGYDITMQAEGAADEPVIEFTSVPPLTSEEIVLMLTTGQIPRSDFGFTNEERASRLALFLGKSFWQKLNPGSGSEERLIIRSGEDVSEEGKQTYSVEYKLSDDWSLVGEYDRFGDLNAGVKWKIFSR